MFLKERKFPRGLILLFLPFSMDANTLTELLKIDDTFGLSGHTQGRRTSSVQFATSGLCAQITSGSNTHLTLDQITPAQNHCHTHLIMISIHPICSSHSQSSPFEIRSSVGHLKSSSSAPPAKKHPHLTPCVLQQARKAAPILRPRAA